MILDELVVHNFGVFADLHSVQLTPRPGKPIVLVGGLNGTGKTTLLEALSLTLFGAHAPPATRRGTGSYEDYLARAIHHRADPAHGASVELAFRVRQSGVEHRLRVLRSWAKRGARMREHLDVLRDGVHDPVLSEQWAEHVESVVPRGVAPLFFFDGEQLEAFADFENAQAMLATAVGALLGLDLVDRLVADLVVLERRKRVSRSDAPTRAELERIERDIGELRRQEQRRVEELTAVEMRLAKVDRRVEELEQRFRTEGGELFEAADALAARRAEVAAQVAGFRDRLRDVAAGPAPLLLVAGRVAELAARTPDVANAAALVPLLEARDTDVLVHLKTTGVRAAQLTAVADFLAADRARRAEQRVEASSGEAVVAARHLHELSLPEAAAAITAVRSDLGCALDELDALDRKLATIPEQDALADLLAERKAVAAERLVIEDHVAAAREALDAVRRDMARRESEAERLLESSTHEELAEEDATRIVTASQRARRTAERFRVAATERHLGRIQRLVLDSLDLLLRKDRLVGDLRIDPVDFGVTLFGNDGRRLHPNQLSAGERQLLATSMLWGLARASARPLPVVIDTPLGRLDSTHRGHLVDRYFPNASHQVVLLSTDEEIDADAWARLRPRTARSYHLAFDEASDGTAIRPGYFFEDRHAS